MKETKIKMEVKLAGRDCEVLIIWRTPNYADVNIDFQAEYNGMKYTNSTDFQWSPITEKLEDIFKRFEEYIAICEEE